MRYVFAKSLLLLLMMSNSLSAQKDVNMEPVSEPALVNSIKAIPVQSLQARELIARAYTAGLAKVAYEQYTLVWQGDPEDPYTNLARGIAAQDYFLYNSRPGIRQLSMAQINDLLLVARSCLAKAQQKLPNSPATNMAYGYFLFFYGSSMPDGLTHIKHAISLDPNNAPAHEALGQAYATATGNSYNPTKAEAELKLACHLNPQDAFPHWHLIDLYLTAHQYQAARRELAAYLTLVPSSEINNQTVKYYQSEIKRAY